jgi:hypothetical protein
MHWPVHWDTPRATVAVAVANALAVYALSGPAVAYVVVGNVYHWLGRSG